MSQYRVFSGPHFPTFGLNTEVYGVNKDQKNSVFGHFSSSAKGFMDKVMDMINIFCTNTFTFILPCVQIQFKGRSTEIGRLLSNRLSNVSLKLEIK